MTEARIPRLGRSGFLLVLLTSLAGCATVPREAGFPDVRDAVADRAGYQVSWLQGADEEAEAAAAVRTLLADSLTVAEAVQVALLNNHHLQATYQDLGVAQAQVVQAGLLGNPVFVGDALFPFEGGAPDLGLEVAFDFLDIFFIPLRKAVARAAFEAAKVRVTGAALDLAGDVRRAFYRHQAAHQRQELLDQVMQAAEASYEVALRLHDAGNIPDLDLHTEQALYEQARLARLAADAEARTRKNHLDGLLGLWGPETQYATARRLPAMPEALDATYDLEAQAVDASLGLQAIRHDLEGLGRRLRLTQATALVPELEVGGAAEREEGAWKAGPLAGLALPLFDVGQARRAAAHAAVRQRQATYRAVAVDVRTAARTLRERLVAAQAMAEHYRTVLLPLRLRITRETQLQYNAMQIGVFQLLQAKKQEIDAGLRYIDALEAFWLARADLDLLLQGRLPAPGDGLDAAAFAPQPADEVGREEH